MTPLHQTHADMLLNQQELHKLCHVKRLIDHHQIPDNPLVPRFIALRQTLGKAHGLELRAHDAANDGRGTGAAA